jgi:flagellar basal body-associated protein FliL
MTQANRPQKDRSKLKSPPSLWQSIILVIIFVFLIVSLFGLIIFLFIRGAQQLGLSPTAYIVIFVVISGIFAWLVKRITDIAASMSQFWFPEDSDEEN